MYQSMSNYDQSSDFYQRQPCFMPNNSNISNLAPPLNQRFQDSHYRFNQPQMLTFYPNLNRSPGVYHHMPGIPPNRQYDEYSSGSCHYRLVNMREGYNAPKLPPRTKNIVKITNPETGDNIFNELEKERKLNIPTENRSENIPKVENGGSSQSSPNTLSSTNLVNQLPNGIPNSASEESASPKTFMNHGLPPGSCESNSLMTSSSASSRPPSVSLASSSQEMASSSTAPSSSFFAAQQASGQSKSQHFNFANGRNGPVDVPFNERPSFHDQGKSVYCNHLPMMIPTFGCRPPYVPPHLQQIPGPRFSGFYNLPHNFYDQPNYYYEGEAMHSFYPHGNPHGFHQNLSRFPPLGHPAASLTQNSQSGSGSNSSEELNSECDLQFLSARLLDKALQNKGNKYSRHVSESRDEDKFKLDEDTPNEHNNTTDMQDVPLSASEKPALESGKSSELDSNSCETSRDAKEITLDPNAKSFVYSGTLLESLKHIAGSSEVSIPGTSFDGNELDSPLLIG